jgi:hypothetical protein
MVCRELVRFQGRQPEYLSSGLELLSGESESEVQLHRLHHLILRPKRSNLHTVLDDDDLQEGVLAAPVRWLGLLRNDRGVWSAGVNLPIGANC